MPRMLFVVGAGASKEFQLPTGAELKKVIAQIVGFKVARGGRGLTGGDDVIHRAIYEFAGRDNVKIDQLSKAASHISETMPQAISIDNFIDSHAHNWAIELMGKLAIVRSILAAEASSLLYVDFGNVYNKPDFGSLEDTWLTKFFQKVTENCRLTNLASRLEAVTMIVFNYDRCIEHFLYFAIQNYYRVSAEDAADYVSKMRIFHPYGTVGPLPWQDQGAGIHFGGEPVPSNLLRLAKGIKTFTEGLESREMEAIKDAVTNAKLGIFLGFAYHKINMQLLQTQVPMDPAQRNGRYFGTAYKISNFNTDAVTKDLGGLGPIKSQNVTVRNDLKCCELFEEYGTAISFV